MELKLDPETLFFHSPPPSAGRPLDYNHLDYVAVAVRYLHLRGRGSGGWRRMLPRWSRRGPDDTLRRARGGHELTSDDPEALSRRAKRYHLTLASAAACISSRGGRGSRRGGPVWRPGWVT